MLTKRRKLFIGACLSLGILLCILGCVGIITIASMTESSSGQLPRRKVVMTIDTSQQQAFFDQLRKFADKHDFTILIDVQPSGAEDFLIYMTREDITISGANPFSPAEYSLGIFDADRQRPVSETVLDDLVTDLKSFVGEVPGATFSVER